jgi:glutamyl-tRNA synthetase
MTVKVRFAPSPTGKLHVGNIRTALVNWLFAKGQGGTFVLRIDDTDLERSTKENEEGIRRDLTWLGMTWDETFKQSEKFERYRQAAEELKAKGLLYPCYETADELERRKKIALSRGKPPVYDRAALELTDEQRKALEAEGRKPHWRFKLSGGRAEWNDLVRGQQSIDTSSVSDPVLIREDGSFLYTMPSVVDDVDAKITHVIRGEDHVTNSGAQIEIFLALGAQPPEMAHMPLLIGADGQGLSKRLGSLSAEQLRNEGYEPLALLSLLSKIGTSDPVEARESLQQLALEFSFSKMGRAPARFDENELNGLNAQIVHAMSFEMVKPRLEKLAYGDQATPEDQVNVDLLSANRDPKVFGTDAADYCPHREIPRGIGPYGLSFGTGMHACIGLNLAAGTLPRADTLVSEHQYGTVTLIARELILHGARPDPDAAGVVDRSTIRNNWASYPILLDL